MEEALYLKQLSTLNSFLNKVYSENKSHAYLLLSEDELEGKLASKLFTLQFVCKNKTDKKPCFTCGNCLKVLNETSVDLFVYPKKNSILVEDIKEIVETSQVRPLDFNEKLYVLNNIQDANIAAQNKLLKTLEEPPHNVVFILTAPSEKSVLATIASRTQKVYLPRINKEEIKAVLTLISEDNKKITIASEVSEGHLGKALDLVKNEAYFNIYYFCLDLISKMTHSKYVLNYANIMEKNRRFITIYLEVLTSFYRDMLMIKENAFTAVINESNSSLLELSSHTYSKEALIKVLEKLNESKKMLDFNANAMGVIDTLLLGILEVKHKWKTS